MSVYDFKKIEQKWQKIWTENDQYKTDTTADINIITPNTLTANILPSLVSEPNTKPIPSLA